MGISPLCSSHVTGSQAKNTHDLHQSFPWLHRGQAKITAFRVRALLLHLINQTLRFKVAGTVAVRI